MCGAVDNLFEQQHLFPERTAHPRPSHPGPAKFDVPYGSPEYFAFFARQRDSFELVFSREELELSCSQDCGGCFAEDPPSLAQYLPAAARGAPSGTPCAPGDWRRTYPLARIHLARALMHFRNSVEASQVSFTCGAAKVEDISAAASRVKPAVLELSNPSPATNNYGYSRFLYELSGPRDWAGEVARSPLPLCVCSYYNELSSWRTTVVEARSPELCVRDLHLLWLLLDYFTVYFSSPIFGNERCFDYLHRRPVGYGGADLRVFLARPLLTSLKEPHSTDSQHLLLEADAYIAYRRMSDSEGSHKVTLDVADAALVLVKQVREHNRGLRGAAGRYLLQHIVPLHMH